MNEKLFDFYKPEKTKTFDDNFKKLTKKDKVLADRIKRKIRDICEYPERGEPLSRNFAGKWSIHVAGHYVILYKIIHEDNVVRLLSVRHHDYAYGKKV
jgi:addiction module toxin, RelE/StbE family